MSAASSMTIEIMTIEKEQRRVFSRHTIRVPLGLVALRSGIPENLPGRCTDLSEGGVGAVIAGELASGQSVAVELRLPSVGLPVRTRALIRHQSRLHYGLEFIGLSAAQREMIRYSIERSGAELLDAREKDGRIAKTAAQTIAAPRTARTRVVGAKRNLRIRVGRRELYVLIASALVLAGLAWWQWQRSWNELEKPAPVSKSELQVPPVILARNPRSHHGEANGCGGSYSNVSACWKGRPC